MSSQQALDMKSRQLRLRSGLAKADYHSLLELARFRVSEQLTSCAPMSPLTNLTATDTTWWREYWVTLRPNVTDPAIIQSTIEEITQLAWEYLKLQEYHAATGPRRSFAGWADRRQAQRDLQLVAAQSTRVRSPSEPNILIPATWTVTCDATPGVLTVIMALEPDVVVENFELYAFCENVLWVVSQWWEGARIHSIAMKWREFEHSLSGTREDKSQWDRYMRLSRATRVHTLTVKVDDSYTPAE